MTPLSRPSNNYRNPIFGQGNPNIFSQVKVTFLVHCISKPYLLNCVISGTDIYSSNDCCRKGRSPSASPRLLQRSATFSFTATMPKKELGWNAFYFIFYFFIYLSCNSMLSFFSHLVTLRLFSVMNACIYSLMMFICIIREANSITTSISTFTFWIC